MYDQELYEMDLMQNTDDGPDWSKCDGCIYSIENDCGQGREYGNPTNCYEDLN